MAAMTTVAGSERRSVEHGNAYNIFILVLTIVSLLVMVLVLLPWIDEETRALLTVYDNVICVLFLIDFGINLAGTRPRRDYFIVRRGWLDLIGSIPTFGVFRFTALLRLARLSRLARISRLLRGNNKKMLIKDVVENRGSYALFITLMLAMLVLGTASVLILQFESRSPGANIKTGGEALWWGVVTITTVGYGDFYPVTTLGRATGVYVMFAGVGIIGALASILASLLVSPSTPAEAAPEGTSVTEPQVAAATTSGIAEELASLRAEIASQRAEIAALRASLEPRAT
jgi:voltage-gated potassium channel